MNDLNFPSISRIPSPKLTSISQKKKLLTPKIIEGIEKKSKWEKKSHKMFVVALYSIIVFGILN